MAAAMKSFEFDPAFKKLMAEIRKEFARAGERERLKMLDDAARSRSNAMDPEEVRRKTIEAAEEMKQLKTLKRKDEQATAAKLEASATFDEKRAKSVAGTKAVVVEAEEEEDPDIAYEAHLASMYRHEWDELWAGPFGRFEDTTLISSMRYTDEPPFPAHVASRFMHTLNVFSVKLAAVDDGLLWPLHVFGIVAVRDSLDHNRNVIFLRGRDDCQIIHQEDPYLKLTGPTRGVVVLNPAEFEVELKVKGSTVSMDRDLSFLIMRYDCDSSESRSHVINRVKTTRLSKLELTFGHIVRSVEATISVRLIGENWPDGLRGLFTASTASIDHMKVTLLAFGDGKVPVNSDGMIALSRCVVCVELDGRLKVSVVARGEDKEAVDERSDKVFTPQRAGRSYDIIKVGSCEMEVTVAWSVFTKRVKLRNPEARPALWNPFFMLSD